MRVKCGYVVIRVGWGLYVGRLLGIGIVFRILFRLGYKFG